MGGLTFSCGEEGFVGEGFFVEVWELVGRDVKCGRVMLVQKLTAEGMEARSSR